MSPFFYAFLVLVILTFPPWHRRLCAFETGEERGENLLRWLLWLCLTGLCTAAGFEHAGHNRILFHLLGLLAVLVLIAGYLEVAASLTVRYLLGCLGRGVPFAAKLRRYITENPDNLYYSRYVPHPFLQYTGRRTRVEGSEANYHYGFKNLTLEDVPKPPGVIRIACLGGSATEDGYPEVLQEHLNRPGAPARFQGMNFGITWWSSVHCIVNYILNVIDFKPDYIVFHENCNDHLYRGFPGFRGDAAHAYRVFQVPPTAGEAFFKVSILYRIVRIALAWLVPSVFRVTPTMADIGLQPGKTFEYKPEELRVFRRNLGTLCAVAAAEGSKVCLATMPLSLTRDFNEEHARVYRPHTEQANRMIREVAEERHVLLADLDALMTGREAFFRYPVHTTPEGDLTKARTIAELVLHDLRLPVSERRS